MDALTSAVLETFRKSLLRPLGEHLERLAAIPQDQRKADANLVELIQESIEVLGNLKEWCSDSKESLSSTLEMSNEEAERRFASMNLGTLEEPSQPSDQSLPLAHLQNDRQLVADFLMHADELMERMSIQLAMLASDHGKEHSPNEIQRDMHSLKGVAAMFGFQEVALVAHHCETAISVLRGNEITFSHEHLQKLLFVHDEICAMLDQIRAHKPVTIHAEDIVAHLSKPTLVSPGRRNTDFSETTEHEIKIDVSKLDRLVKLVAAINTQKHQLLSMTMGFPQHGQKGAQLNRAFRQFDRSIEALQSLVMQLRMIPLEHIFSSFHRVIRDVTRETEKKIELNIQGAMTRLDKSIAEKLLEPLVHILRNACDHGIEPSHERKASGKAETGVITVKARQIGNTVIISVADDGAGLNVVNIEKAAIAKGLITKGKYLTTRQTHELIFQPGLSTAKTLTHISGRGIGMDIVKERILKMGGSISVESLRGFGTTFILSVPLTLAVQKTILVAAKDQTYAIPEDSIFRSVCITAEQSTKIGDTNAVKVDGRVIPMVWLRNLIDSQTMASPTQKSHQFAVIMGKGDRQFALVVDRLLHAEELVVKQLTPVLGLPEFISGGALLGNGDIALILNPSRIGNDIQSASLPRRVL